MSSSSFTSFNTNIQYDQPMWSFSGTSQSTEDTDVSYIYPDPSVQQTSNNIGPTNLFNHVGYGATHTLEGVPSGLNEYGRPTYRSNATASASNLQPHPPIYHAEPWSSFAPSQSYATYPYPSPSAQIPTAQRLWQVDQAMTGYCPHQDATAMSPSASSDGWYSGQGEDVSSQGQLSNLVQSQRSPSSSGQSEKIRLPKLRRTKPQPGSNDNTAKHRFFCPECGQDFSRPDSVTRHILDKHTPEGPFWRCDLCPSGWGVMRRLDKMWSHCREKHPDDILEDINTQELIFPYHEVLDVGGQQYESRVSTNGKRTRRRRKRIELDARSQ